MTSTDQLHFDGSFEGAWNIMGRKGRAGSSKEKQEEGSEAVREAGWYYGTC